MINITIIERSFNFFLWFKYIYVKKFIKVEFSLFLKVAVISASSIQSGQKERKKSAFSSKSFNINIFEQECSEIEMDSSGGKGISRLTPPLPVTEIGFFVYSKNKICHDSFYS